MNSACLVVRTEWNDPVGSLLNSSGEEVNGAMGAGSVGGPWLPVLFFSAEVICVLMFSDTLLT